MNSIILPTIQIAEFAEANGTIVPKPMKNEVSSQAPVYGLGLIGAAIYYIQQASTFWAGVIGILKAIVWPAFLVYDALKALHS